MTSATPCLEFFGIAKAYGSKLLFRNASASFFPGTISLLAGANGSGKSTLLKIAAGLEQPDAGIVKRSVDQKRIGYMAHATFIYPAMEARENLVFWSNAAGLPSPDQKVDEVLQKTGLTRSAHEKAGIFSRGMAQRLNLARMLLNDPLLILLDEPATGLDTQSRAMLGELMQDSKKRGASILWISHSIDDDSKLADRIFSISGKTLNEEPLPPC